jgi:hypothetical protein
MPERRFYRRVPAEWPRRRPLGRARHPSTRPGGVWGPASRPADPRLTDFGATLFDLAAARAQPPGRLVFDVCHAGVVLRALLFVHGVMAVGVAFGAKSSAPGCTLTAAGAGVTLPAVLGWLLVACGLQAPARRPCRCRRSGWRRSGSARRGRLGALLGSFLMPDMRAFGRVVWIPHALAGAAWRRRCSSGCRCVGKATPAGVDTRAPRRAAVAHPTRTSSSTR